jgi:hypothetical protein
MNRYDIFLFFHILSVVAWVGAGTTLGLLWLHPDPELRERIGPLGEWLGPRLFAPAALGALAFGLALVEEGHWGFAPLWVDLGLAAFGSSFLLNAGARSRLSRERRFRPTLAALARFELALLYLTVADMVLKPSGSDRLFLAIAGGVLAAAAAPVVWRFKSAEAGTTSG